MVLVVQAVQLPSAGRELAGTATAAPMKAATAMTDFILIVGGVD